MNHIIWIICYGLYSYVSSLSSAIYLITFQNVQLFRSVLKSSLDKSSFGANEMEKNTDISHCCNDTVVTLQLKGSGKLKTDKFAIRN